jgi:hypothetical protein
MKSTLIANLQRKTVTGRCLPSAAWVLLLSLWGMLPAPSLRAANSSLRLNAGSFQYVQVPANTNLTPPAVRPHERPALVDRAILALFMLLNSR